MPVSPSTEALIREHLLRAGRLPDQQVLTFLPVAQNPDRKDAGAVQRHVVSCGETKVAFLTTGENLEALRQKTELFSTAYPALACPVFAHGSSQDGAFLLAEHFDGVNADAALADPQIGPERVLAALQVVAGHYARALQPSTKTAALAELRGLFARVLAITHWTAIDRVFLSSVVFPFAEQQLCPAKPCQRVSNGDFTLTNIMVNARGEVRVIDYEGAYLTHFFAEDWLRLTYWKAPEAIRRFALDQIPENAPINLYLWLMQLAFEDEVIVPSRARLDMQHWGHEIRRLIEQQSPEMQQSLLWPSSAPEASRRLLRLFATASRNYNRAIELGKSLYPKHSGTNEDIQMLLLQLNSTQFRLYLSEAKILRMQQTFSWRATAWLRALRRILIDPYFPPPPAPDLPPPTKLVLNRRVSQISNADFIPPVNPTSHFHIVTPSTWNVKAGELKEVSGWVFTDEPITVRQVRARIGDKIFVGLYGLDRSEIAEKFLPQAHSGFRIDIVVEESDTFIELEFSDSNGEWFLFFAQTLNTFKPSLVVASEFHLDTARKQYTRWVKLHDTITPKQIDTLRRQIGHIQGQPLISIVLPVYNTPEQWLCRAIESVRKQVYPKWELCIADDASSAPHIRPLLTRLANEDNRIKVVFRSENGHISAASNSALEIATGEFVAFLDHDDEIEPHALYYFAKLISQHADAEVVYSDEDKIDESGKRFDPYFKPDWNPDLLNGQNYLCHLVAYRTATARAAGGFREGLEGSQDWDLALRITEQVKPQQIYHVPRVLYHWRTIIGSTANEPEAKEYTTRAAHRALEEHFTRQKQEVSLDLIRADHWHIRYSLPLPPPLVTLIIPTRNRRELLVTCIESILTKTDYPNFEILIADNDSDDPELFSFYDRTKATARLTVLPCPGPFNFSAIVNRAVQQARGTVIGLLNNDLETMHPEWLDEMVRHALRPEIGVVGAKLYYPDMCIQHAGVITGLGGVAGHAFKGFSRNNPGTAQFRPHLAQNLTAVTAACAVLRKTVFEEAGGFNETELKVAFNDVDFCLRVQSLGYRNLFTPFAELIHHESASRGVEDTPEKIARFQSELDYMKLRWGERLLNDPAYNPNLTLDQEDFSLAYPPRTAD